MKTLADFKKKIQVGAKIHTLYHQKQVPNVRDEKGQIVFMNEDKGTREVSIKQTTQFALKTTRTDGKVVDSWLHYPKASECLIVNENTIQILDTDYRKTNTNGKLIPLLTYTFINE